MIGMGLQVIKDGQDERRSLEAQVAELSKRVVAIEHTERAARQQAQDAMRGLRREVEAARSKVRRGPAATNTTKPPGPRGGTATINTEGGR
jgi:predicted  nucleic acid-binding Zn-ribbon protein